MADKRDTGGARQTAREVRRRREKRKRYEALIEEHPAVKTLRARMAPERPKAPVKRGIPKLIAEAMQDKDVATAVTAMRRVMGYHRRAGSLARRRLKGERIPLKEQIALIRQGENIERDFQEMLRSAARAARGKAETEAYATAIAAQPDDTEVIDNLPSFFSRDELAAIKYLGVGPQRLSESWDQLYTQRRQEVMELMASGKINEALERVEESADRLEFPEAPRYLVKRGILTLGGDGDYDAVPIVAAVATAVVAVVLTAVAAAPVVVAIAAVATYVLATVVDRKSVV